MSARRPLLEALPRLAGAVRFERLGDFPTPVESLSSLRAPGAELFAKRDDRSSPIYGGNKVRTLEGLFGEALDRGATRIHSTGAYGTNHGLAAALHAPRVGLEPGAILFPQPVSECALVNLRAILASGAVVHAIPHWSALPFAMIGVGRREAREGRKTTIMMPGGATPTGGLGYVNAGLELAEQVAAGELPRPSVIVVGIGSNCTTAGLLVGLRLAAKLGVGFTEPPRVHGVRVTPWPVTSRFRILSLAVDVAAHLATLAGDPSLAFSRATLGAGLEVDGSEIGWGYGLATQAGRDVIARFRRELGWELDTTYSAKAMAGALSVAAKAKGPVVYWSTKSTAPLPEADEATLRARAPASMLRWMERAEKALARRRAKGLEPP